MLELPDNHNITEYGRTTDGIHNKRLYRLKQIPRATIN